jgi:hypothetical protein
MPLDPDTLTSAGPDLETLKFEVGEKFKGTLIDLDEVPHTSFDTGEQEFTKSGTPKTKWIVRLRRADATDASADLKWWTQNQVKFAVREALVEHLKAGTAYGAEVGIERLADAEPRQKGYRGAAQYRVVVITPGPKGWVDPLAAPAAADVDIDIDAF